MAVSRPDPIMFNDAIRTTHVENSGPDVSITLLSVKKLLVSSVHKFSEWKQPENLKLLQYSTLSMPVTWPWPQNATLPDWLHHCSWSHREETFFIFSWFSIYKFQGCGLASAGTRNLTRCEVFQRFIFRSKMARHELWMWHPPPSPPRGQYLKIFGFKA